MVLIPSNSSNLEQLALKELNESKVRIDATYKWFVYDQEFGPKLSSRFGD